MPNPDEVRTRVISRRIAPYVQAPAIAMPRAILRPAAWRLRGFPAHVQVRAVATPQALLQAAAQRRKRKENQFQKTHPNQGQGETLSIFQATGFFWYSQ